MFSARSLISAAEGTASRMIRTYVHYPTNSRPSSRTPLSSFLSRCALSTTPENISYTSGGSHSMNRIEEAKSELTVGDNTINNLPEISSVIQSSLSVDSNSSESAKSSLYKPMDRDERMAYLEETIKNKDAVVMRLSEEIASAIKRRDQLLDKEVLTSNESNRLTVIEEVDLPDMRVREKRFATEIVELKAELSALRNPKKSADSSLPAQVHIPSSIASLWSGLDRAVNGPIFPEESFGRIVLSRDRVLTRLTQLVQDQASKQPNLTRSVYICGCRGMGKTSTLALIGDYYSKMGHEVYFYESASEIPFEAAQVFVNYLKDNKKKNVVILIDEVVSIQESSIFVKLLKGRFPNLFVIGAAVPSSLNASHSAYFKRKLEIFELVLRPDDADYLLVVDFVTKLHIVSSSVTAAICRYILDYCGGHLFPTLHFIEVFFTLPEMSSHLQSIDTFCLYFHSADFAHSEYHREVQSRCFFSDSRAEDAASHFLSANYSSGDLTSLEKFGWFDKSSNKLISKLLENYCLRNSALKVFALETLAATDSETSKFDNILRVILAGFSTMQGSDFLVSDSKGYVPIENALSFNWAKHAMGHFLNIHMDSQVTSTGGYVDFYVDGYCDHAVEFIRNATVANCDKHVSRFTVGKYHWKNFVLVNFAMESPVVVLPTNEAFHGIFFTYVHSSNTLYRGAKAIISPATKMSSPKPAVLTDNNDNNTNNNTAVTNTNNNTNKSNSKKKEIKAAKKETKEKKKK